jgi:hypothetical protein
VQRSAAGMDDHEIMEVKVNQMARQARPGQARPAAKRRMEKMMAIHHHNACPTHLLTISMTNKPLLRFFSFIDIVSTCSA